MPAAFLVDGHTEQRFLKMICPKAPVQRLNLNGGGVSAEAISKRAATHIRLWGGKYYPIVVIVDLEDRAVGHDVFASKLHDAIVNNGISDQLRVCVAKRMVENWILADSDLLDWKDAPESVDELHGANILRGLLKEYDKAGDGPNLLLKARASKIRHRSPSFNHAYAVLSGLSCAWLVR